MIPPWLTFIKLIFINYDVILSQNKFTSDAPSNPKVRRHILLKLHDLQRKYSVMWAFIYGQISYLLYLLCTFIVIKNFLPYPLRLGQQSWIKKLNCKIYRYICYTSLAIRILRAKCYIVGISCMRDPFTCKFCYFRGGLINVYWLLSRLLLVSE